MKGIKVFIFAFIISLVSVCTVSYASTFTEIILEGRKNKLPDLPSNYTETYPYYVVIYDSTSEFYQLHMFKNIMVIDYKNSSGDYMLFQYPENNVASAKIYTSDLSTWGTGLGGHTQAITVRDSHTVVVYSNFDIKDTSGSVHYVSYELNSAIPEEDDDSGFWSSLFNRLTDGFNSIIQGLGNVVSKIGEVISSVIDVIVGIPQAILDGFMNLLEFLFKPDASSNLTHEVKYLLEEKFGFLFQIGDLIRSIMDIDFYSGTPKFEITYKGITYQIIDFAIFIPYRPYVRSIASFIMIFSTLLWLLKNAPSLIRGGSALSDIDVETSYMHNYYRR